uniref:Capsid protein n=1 Tax=Chicken anemia virus TaxID=12618 RepID=G3FAK5_9VIRU|nr:VP1 [Chicken anemia virus]
MARRARRPRGRFYAFRRGRWHHLKRLRRRYKFRHRRRQRYCRRAFRKAFHNPRPGTYSVRLPNPQSTMTIRFQGVIFLTEGLILPKNSTAGGYADHMYGARVAKISVNLKEFLLASMNLTYVSKLGGPIAGELIADGSKSEAAENWPNCWLPLDNNVPSATPSAWWRWALMMMQPTDSCRFFNHPKQMTLQDMGRMFGGWHLFRHIETRFQLLATKNEGSFSPVASLLSQGEYLTRRDDVKYSSDHQNRWRKGEQPMTGGIAYATGKMRPDEQQYPAMPPDPPIITSTTAQGTQVRCMNSTQAWWSWDTYMSFATLTALGAQWSFPPGQRSVSRRSFNHHKARGAGDPKGQRWHTLVPLGTETITDSYMGAPASEIDTNFFTLYVAQGTNKSQQYKFGTATYALKEPVMKSDSWAVVRVQSVWQLGNRQRPYPWDVNWANSTMYWGSQP